MAVGGVIAVVPEMHKTVVDIHQWMSSEAFATAWALAQAAPGPGVIVVTLIGWHVAGAVGAIVATVAVCTPSFVITYGISRLWSRYSHHEWYKVFERGIVPITVGLILSGGVVLTTAAASSWATYGVVAATVAFGLLSRASPLIALAAAAVIGLLGLL